MRYLFSLYLFPFFLVASPVDLSQTDLIPRGINFIIFIIILWFLLAGKAKTFFAARRKKISNQLSEVQNRLKAAKKEKEQALRKLEEAKEIAMEIAANAKKESYLVVQKIEEQARVDIETTIKNTESLMEFETKRMQKEVVTEVLDEVFAEVHLSAQEYGNILERKVG